jgi:hypothetical protein
MTEPWTTTAVYPPPPGAWLSVFRSDADGSLSSEPAVAVLLQESMNGSARRTRTVFATVVDGELVPACDRPGYVTSTTTSTFVRVNGGARG